VPSQNDDMQGRLATIEKGFFVFGVTVANVNQNSDVANINQNLEVLLFHLSCVLNILVTVPGVP
jgi:hypothetical protein